MQQENHKKHALLSASGCNRWWNCPGSVEATKDTPRSTSKFAAEGTLAHALAYEVLTKVQSFEQLEARIGETVMVEDFEIEITEEMCEAILIYIRVVENNLIRGAIIKYEEQMDLSHLHPEMDMMTCDCVIHAPFQSLTVIDLKYGKGVSVSAVENKQLLMYALAASKEADVDEVRLIIVQPRSTGEAVKEFTLTAAELRKFGEELKLKAYEAMLPGVKRVAGSWCKFCPAQATCDAARQKVQGIIAHDFDDPAPKPHLPTPESMGLVRIKKILESAEYVTDWLTQCEAYAKQCILNGVRVPGYKLINKYGHRKWVSEEIVRAEFETELGEKLFTEPKLKSPAQVEKIVGKDRMEGLTERPSGPALVPEGTKGEEYTVNIIKPEHDF